MRYLQLLVLTLFIVGCGNADADKTTKTENSESDTHPVVKLEDTEELTEIKGHRFTQYYPGKKQIKFQGMQDDEKRRHGKWTYYSKDGRELSTTMFNHGVKHGHMVVKRENGALYYHGEMENGKKVGIWKNYDENGNFLNEDDFGGKE